MVIDLFPSHGPPSFRYTGVDPARDVWNLGWPLTLAIYDPQTGLHDGPFLYFVLPLQAAPAGLGFAIWLFLYWRGKAWKQ